MNKMINPEQQSHDKISYCVEPEDQGHTIKQFLRKKWHISGRLLSKLKKEAGVSVNGMWSPFHAKLREGDILLLNMEEEACNFEPQDLPFEILYEDEDVLVVNKPPGILTHPSTNKRDGTLANAITHHMVSRNEIYKVRFANRLDMDTSGVMIVAKNAFSHHLLMLQMNQNQMVKTYRAFVCGCLKISEGEIDAPVYRQENLPDDEPPRRIVDQRGKHAVSRFWVEKMYKQASLLRLVIETGRTHQIRVHMNHIGHPVIGDTFYAPGQVELIGRQALHAAEIEFNQPRYGKRIHVTAGFPEDLLELERKLEKL
jgi:23S rRNA pseudouridine1911/1915/1917 synthase